jgi:hypothetical protein
MSRPAFTSKAAVASVLLSLVSCIFFLIGAIGGSETSNVIEAVPWLYSSKAKSSVGLAAILVDGNILKLDELCRETSKFCEACFNDGKQIKTGVGLSAISLTLALVAAISVALRIKVREDTFMKTVSFGAALLPVIFTIANLASYSGCAGEFNKEEDIYDYSTGWILSLVGLLLMIACSVINLLTDCTSDATVLPK